MEVQNMQTAKRELILNMPNLWLTQTRLQAQIVELVEAVISSLVIFVVFWVITLVI